MNVTHVVENLERGGLERMVIDLVLAQRDAGARCRVVCLFQPGALASELTARGVELVACGKRRGPDLRALVRVRLALRQSPREVLHTHNVTAHYYAVAAAFGLGFRTVLNTRHGMGGFDPAKRSERLYRCTMPGTDSVVAVSNTLEEVFHRGGVRPRSALLSIPNGLQVERFPPGNADARARLVRELGLEPGTRLLGTVGRLHPVKNQALLVRAFARLCPRSRPSALVMVGDGALRDELVGLAEQEGVAGKVRFLGDRNDVPRLLQGLDIFVLPSLTEGYSVALLEACAAGLPIVATRVGGNGEIVRHGFNGLLVPSGDVEALATALSTLLADEGARRSLGAAGRRWILDCGSMAAMASRYARVYGW